MPLKNQKAIQNSYVQAALILCLVLLLFFFDVLFLHKTLASLQIPGVYGDGPFDYGGPYTHRALIDPGGSSWGPRPHTMLISEQLKELLMPLWNPYMGVGQPLAANMDSNAYSPIRVLLHLWPSAFIWDLFLIFRLFLAGFFSFAFFKSINISQISSIFAAALYMVGGYFIFNIDMHHVDVEIFFPLLLLCYEKILHKNKVGLWGVLYSVVIFCMLTGGQPQSAFLNLSIGTLYFMVRLLCDSDSKNFQVIKGHLLNYIIFTLIGFGLSAFLLLPFYEFMQLSFNNHDPKLGNGIGTSYNPYLSDIISFITPYFLGPIHGSWLKGYSWHILTRGYWGVTALFFALCSLLLLFRVETKRFRPIILFFSLALIAMLCKFYGLPMINWIGQLPIANMINFGKYMGPIMCFCTAVLAGIGLDALSNSPKSTSTIYKASFLIFSLVLVSFSYFYFFQAPLFRPLSRQEKLIPLGLTVACIFIIFIYVYLHIRNHKISLQRFKIGIFLIAILELYLYVPNFGVLKERNDRTDLFKKAPYIEYLQKNLGEYRVVGLNRDLYPDFGSAFKVSDIRVLDALLPKIYMEFIGNFFKLPSPPDRFTGDEGIDLQDSATERALNMLGVKYIISNSNIKGISLIDDIFSKGKIVSPTDNPKGSWINVSSANLNGVHKKILFEHAPSQISYSLIIPPERASLQFSIGLLPDTWSPIKGDGVTFKILLENNKKEIEIFSKYIDPKNNTRDRQWFNESINLNQYAGKEITLKFVTDATLNNSFDWAAWGDIRLNHSIAEEQPVYDKDLKIFENKKHYPRAFVLYNYEVIDDKTQSLARLKSANFNPETTAILTKEIALFAPQTSTSKGPHFSTATITNYSSQKVVIKTTLEKPGLLVLTDLFYPGWKAYVNQSEVEILQTDYIFRSIPLDVGTHEIVFTYQPQSFATGLKISIASLLLLLLIGLVSLLKLKGTKSIANYPQ